MAATPGTAVTSKNPATNTNTSLTVTLASTTIGVLNTILLFGEAAGTAVNLTVTTPAGWTKQLEQFTAAGTPAVTSILFSRVFQSGDPSTVAVSWTNAGQAMAFSVPYTGFDTTTPFGTPGGANKSGSTGAWTVSSTTSGAGCFTYAMMNRTGIAGGGAAYSATTDNVLANDSVTASSVSGVAEYVTGSTATGAAFTKTATGPATSIGTYLWWTDNDAAGAFTGTASLAAAATITAAGVVGTSTSATLAVSAATTANGGGTTSSTATLATTATVTAAGTVGVAGAATLAATATLTAAASTPAKLWVTSRAGGTQYVGWRDGLPTIYGEETLEGYTAAAAYNTGLALEISLWDTSDGVYVCSHDSTTGRVFSGTNRTINSTTWATFSPNGAFVTTGRPTTLVGGNVMRRLEEIVNAFPTRIFVIENKHGTNQSTLVTLLQSLCPGRWIFKGPYNDTTNANTSSGSGAPVWLYWYPADLTNLSTSYTALATAVSNGVPIIFGLGDYSTAPVPIQSDAGTFFTFTAAHSIYTWAHILGTGAQKTTADGQASTAGTPFDGYMVSNVANVIPSDSGTAAISATATITAAGTVGAVGAATLTNTATTTTAGTVAAFAAATLSTTATITAAGVVGTATTAAPAITATITTAGTVGKGSGAALAGTATVTSAGVKGDVSGATLSTTATVTAAGVVGEATGAALAGTVTITAAGAVVAGGTSTAALTVTAVASAAGAVAANSTAAVASTATIAAAGTVAVSGTAVRAITATITAAGTVGAATTGTAQIAAAVAITATGLVGGTGTPPASRTYTVAAEDRTYVVAIEVRILTVAAEDRTLTTT